MKKTTSRQVIGLISILFVTWAEGACFPAGTAGDDVSVCTGTINTSVYFYGGSDRVTLDHVSSDNMYPGYTNWFKDVFYLDEALGGNPATDGDDHFESNNSMFYWAFGFGGDDLFQIHDSRFDNLYGETNPLRGFENRGDDRIEIDNSTSYGYILGGNDSDTIIIRDSNVTYVASGYSYPMPFNDPTVLYDYTPYDSNDTLFFDHVNFNAPLYYDPSSREGAVEGGKGDDTITFVHGGEAFYVYGGYGNDTITVFDDEHFNACDNATQNNDRCGIYGDEPYEDEPNATLIPRLHGDDLITFYGGDIRGILVHGGDGSDRVIVETPVLLSGTEFNGGDDRSVSDGFVDQLRFENWQGDINGSLLRNWEQIVLAEETDIRLMDMELNASTDSGVSVFDDLGYGVTVQEQARLRVDHDATVHARLFNNGTIDLSEDGAADTTLRIEGNYSADQGSLHLDTVLDGNSPGTSDILHVTGDTSGTTELRITHVGGTGAQTTGDGILVVEVDGDSAGDFTLYESPLVAGSYLYTLHKATNGNWYLRSSLPEINITVVEGYVWYDDNANGQQESGERQVTEGVIVELLDEKDDVIAQTRPDGEGYYRFLLEYHRSYRLHFVLSESLQSQHYQIGSTEEIDAEGYTRPFETIADKQGTIRLDVGIVCGCLEAASDRSGLGYLLITMFLPGILGMAIRKIKAG